jgi:hypothetical protein
MKTHTIRRLVAVIASTGLLIAAAPAIAPAANAADACALGATCEGSLTGKLGTTTFKIQMPTKFNGTVLVYSHGYRVGTPVPAALAVPLGLNDPTGYVATKVPAFAAAFGTDVAYVGAPLADIAPSATVRDNLLAQGYALSGVGYAKQGWATAEGVEANELLMGYIRNGGISGVKKTMTWGTSLGGLIAATVAERNPKTVAGVLADCAPLMGPQQAFSGAMTVLYTWKSTIAPTLRVANYESYTQALTDLGTVLTVLTGYPAKTGVNSALGFPIAQANMLGGLMAGLPTKSTVYDGQTVNPAYATLGTLAAVSAGYSPASAGASTAGAMLENVGAAAALGILGRYELEQRVRAISGMAATDSANFNDNVNVQYSELLSREQRGEFGDTLNAGAVNLNGMLNAIDATKGSTTLRYPANPVAVKVVQALPAPKGIYANPTVLLTTSYDPIVAPANTFDYYAKLMASAKKAGTTAKVAQYYTMPVEDGYTKFAPDGKSPDAKASAAANISGVGHCAFSLDNWGAVTKSVATLNALTNAKTTAAVKTAKSIGYGGPAVNGDGFYVPEALKRPGITTS